MSEITLVKQPVRFIDSNNKPMYLAERVVGLTLNGERTLSEYGHTFTGSEQEEQLSLPDETLDNLAEFYKQTQAVAPDKRPKYSCHTFVYFVLGKTCTIGLCRDFYDKNPTIVEHPDSLVAGESYFTINSSGQANHSMLGINRPAFNLSVDGDNRPLHIISNRNIMKTYNADYLERYEPLSITYY